MLRNMFKKTYTKIDTKYKPQAGSGQRPVIPEGLWRRCNKHRQPIYVEDVKNNYCVCPKCNDYFRVHTYHRIEMLVDEGTLEERNEEMPSSNPLNSPGYGEKVLAVRERSRLSEAIVIGKCKIDGNPVVVDVYDARFIMGSMDHVVDEKITDAIECATREKMPVTPLACLDRARMQGGTISLMQIVKISAALGRHHETGQLFISVLMSPITGGAAASFAMLGDIISAEPHALIGSAGPRVIEQIIGQRLPEGFRRSEFLPEHGFVDKIMGRRDQKRVIGQTLYMYRNHKMNIESKNPAETARTSVDKLFESQEDGEKVAWDTILLPRKSDRPVATDYINVLLDEFIEFREDRYSKDGGTIMGGAAVFHGMPVTVIEQQKGKNTKDSITHNFGVPSLDGYCKAPHLIKQVETFRRPIVCFVDTSGAFCGLEAEGRGQGEAIARSLFKIFDLKVPVLFIVVGRDGNGGALAVAVANEAWMLKSTIYSILSSEGFASILYKDSRKAPGAAKVVKAAAKDLLQLKLIERTVPEGQPAYTDNLYRLIEYVDSTVAEFLKTYFAMSDEEPREHRYQRFRRM